MQGLVIRTLVSGLDFFLGTIEVFNKQDHKQVLHADFFPRQATFTK